MPIALESILSLSLFLCLNPVTWIVEIVCALRSKAYWIPAIGGLLTQTICIIALLSVLGGFDAVDFPLGEILTGFLVPAILSGLLIPTLVFLLVRQRRLQQPEPS